MPVKSTYEARTRQAYKVVEYSKSIFLLKLNHLSELELWEIKLDIVVIVLPLSFRRFEEMCFQVLEEMCFRWFEEMCFW